jgi:putative phage-type endonuclease
MNQIEQGTLEWLRHRHKGIGASDVPVVMNVSPYKKPFDLWEEKIQPEPKFSEPNFIQQKGHNLEPVARAMAELELGMSFTPKLVENEKHGFLKASLDGLSECGQFALEIKYVGRSFAEECPDKYYPQIQYQYALTNAKKIYLVQINDDKNISIIHVPMNETYIKETMMPAVFNFWKMVTEKSYNIDPVLKTSLEKYAKMKRLSDLIEEKFDVLKKSIYTMSGPKLNYGLFNISTVNKAGEIDYKKIVEEKFPDLDLEPFRKRGTSYQQIKISKPKKSK